MKSPRTLTLPVRFRHLVSECPNFHRTGSITGMRKLYYGAAAQLVRCGSWIYNVSESRSRDRIIDKAH